jgi:hypothetical protein
MQQLRATAAYAARAPLAGEKGCTELFFLASARDDFADFHARVPSTQSSILIIYNSSPALDLSPERMKKF